jgi:hypothetical protein
MSKDKTIEFMKLRAATQREINARDHENRFTVGSQNTVAETTSENLRQKFTPVDTIKETQGAHTSPSPKPKEDNIKDKLAEEKRLSALDALKKPKTPDATTVVDKTNAPTSPSPFKIKPSPFD